MLRTNSFANEPIRKLIEDISRENARYDRELRSSHREKMVLPAEIAIDDQILTAFTRNLSLEGACILSLIEIEASKITKLKIIRPDGSEVELLSECRWCKPFGKGFWISGWRFLSVAKK